jgi:predicted amino acid-binding ACT domain protein
VLQVTPQSSTLTACIHFSPRISRTVLRGLLSFVFFVMPSERRPDLRQVDINATNTNLAKATPIAVSLSSLNRHIFAKNKLREIFFER